MSHRNERKKVNPTYILSVKSAEYGRSIKVDHLKINERNVILNFGQQVTQSWFTLENSVLEQASLFHFTKKEKKKCNRQ